MPQVKLCPNKKLKSSRADHVSGYDIDIVWEDWPHVSDGVATNVPRPSSRMLPSRDVSWRRILGKVWVDYRPIDGRAEGRVYELRRLPPGYTFYERMRRDFSRNDFFIYGHPSGKHFNSAKLFATHFLHICKLMHGEEHVCECVLCAETREDEEKERLDRG